MEVRDLKHLSFSNRPEAIETMKVNETPNPALTDRAAWWPVAPVASAVGLSRDLFLAAVERGELPIRCQSFGARGLWFAARVDVMNYLKQFQPREGHTA